MHSSTDRVIDHQYRLRCRRCDATRFAELGGEKQERADAGEDVTVRCGRCKASRAHEVVAP